MGIAKNQDERLESLIAEAMGKKRTALKSIEDAAVIARALGASEIRRVFVPSLQDPQVWVLWSVPSGERIVTWMNVRRNESAIFQGDRQG